MNPDTPLPPHPSTSQCVRCGQTKEWHKMERGVLYCDLMPRDPFMTFTPRPHPLSR